VKNYKVICFYSKRFIVNSALYHKQIFITL